MGTPQPRHPQPRPRRWGVYALIAGVTMFAGWIFGIREAPPAIAQVPAAVTLSTDRLVYTTGTTVTFTIQVTNPSEHEVTLNFPSGQIYDISIGAPGGFAEVWRWSVGRTFTQAVTPRTLAPGESMTITEVWPQVGGAGSTVPTGVYFAAARILADVPLSSGVVTFMIGEDEPVPVAGCFTLRVKVSDGTPLELLARGIEPAEALQGMWIFRDGGWMAWTPGSGIASPLVNFRDAITFCVDRPVRWIHPV